MGMHGGPRVHGSGHGRLLPPGCQPLLLPFVGISYRYIQRARMGLNSPPSPPPSFPTAAISDSCSQRVRFLPGHQHCPAQPALSATLWDAPAVLAGMGRLIPLAHPGRPECWGTHSASLPSCRAASCRVCKAQSLSLLLFNDDGQSNTHRSSCQTREHGPGFVLMARWVLQARGRWEHGPSPVLSVQGRML